MSGWRGYIDGIRVDRVAGGYAAGHPDYAGVKVMDCPWCAAWHVARCVRVAAMFGLRKEGDDRARNPASPSRDTVG